MDTASGYRQFLGANQLRRRAQMGIGQRSRTQPPEPKDRRRICGRKHRPRHMLFDGVMATKANAEDIVRLLVHAGLPAASGFSLWVSLKATAQATMRPGILPDVLGDESLRRNRGADAFRPSPERSSLSLREPFREPVSYSAHHPGGPRPRSRQGWRTTRC